MTGESFSSKLPLALVVLLLVVGVFMFFSQNQSGAVVRQDCVPSTESCDGLDNDCDAYADEGCDNDNDNYCDSSMTRASPYSCAIISDTIGTNCCTLGGGDCADNNVSINPGVVDNCFDSVDNDCDGITNDGCAPYTCSDSDPVNNAYVGGSITITSATGATNTNYYPDGGCFMSTSGSNIYQYSCLVTSFSSWSPSSVITGSWTSCPSKTTCTDPAGTPAAYCAK